MRNKKEQAIRSLIKYMGKERRKSYRKLPIMKWYILLTLSMLGCFGLSCYLSNNTHCAWWSSLLQSCGAGILTGMIVFISGNVRSQTQEKIELKVKQISDLYQVLEMVYNSLPDKAYLSVCKGECSFEECAYLTIIAGMEYVEKIEKLDYSILKLFLEQNVFDFEEKKKALVTLSEQVNYEKLSEDEARRIRGKVITIIQDASIWFEEQLKRAEIQKQQMGKYPL